MLKITGNKISLTRGDTAFITVQMYNNDGDAFAPADDDTVYFNVKRRYSDSDTAIKKQVPTDTMVLELEPADTKSLQFADYVYEFEYTDSDGHVDTFLNGTLSITSEVD